MLISAATLNDSSLFYCSVTEKTLFTERSFSLSFIIMKRIPQFFGTQSLSGPRSHADQQSLILFAYFATRLVGFFRRKLSEIKEVVNILRLNKASYQDSWSKRFLLRRLYQKERTERSSRLWNPDSGSRQFKQSDKVTWRFCNSSQTMYFIGLKWEHCCLLFQATNPEHERFRLFMFVLA